MRIQGNNSREFGQGVVIAVAAKIQFAQGPVGFYETRVDFQCSLIGFNGIIDLYLVRLNPADFDIDPIQANPSF